MNRLECESAQLREVEEGKGFIVRIPFSQAADPKSQKQLSDIFNAKTYGIHQITADYVEVQVERESDASLVVSAVQHTVDVANGDATLG